MSGSDINPNAIEFATNAIIQKNKILSDHFSVGSGNEIILQKDPNKILHNMIAQDFDFTICNPPFFNSLEERTLKKESGNETY